MTRLPAVLVAIALLASLGAGSRVLLCEMGSTPRFGCPCPHVDHDDPCETIRHRCCKVSDVANAPAAAWANSDRNDPERALALGRLQPGASEFSAGPPRYLLATRRPGLSARAGPPIFLEVCSYLI